ncbi:hypothetical protein [Actinoplanes sp. G11-F43]|uniref:hypothetical protein n=1 Tax=Actinoplanes sp. G11-F43 TaxID=3424130 RepID=UPI003D3375B6
MTSQTSPLEQAGPLWGTRYPPRWILPFITVTGALTVAALALAGQSAGRGSWAGAGMCLGFAALCGHLAGYGVYLRWIPLRRGPAMPENDPCGTGFAYSKWAYYWYVTPVVLAVLGLAWFGWLSDSVLLAGVVLVCCLAGAVPVGIMCYLAPGRLTLSPDGVHHRGLALTQFSPWTSIAGVGAIESGQERTIVIDVDPGDDDRIRHFLPKDTHPLLPAIVVSDTWLLTDPTLVHETLRHYLDNPGDRHELGTRAAVDRIRHRRFGRRSPAGG